MLWNIVGGFGLETGKGKEEAATNQMEINTYMKHIASRPAPTWFLNKWARGDAPNRWPLLDFLAIPYKDRQLFGVVKNTKPRNKELQNSQKIQQTPSLVAQGQNKQSGKCEHVSVRASIRVIRAESSRIADRRSCRCSRGNGYNSCSTGFLSNFCEKREKRNSSETKSISTRRILNQDIKNHQLQPKWNSKNLKTSHEKTKL